MRIFVTGASGWIGSAVVPDLIDAGHSVAGLARSDASAAKLRDAGAEVVRGSLDDLDALAGAARDADGVLHLAFKHEQAFAGDFATAVEADQRAIETFGEALAGSEKPLVLATGLAGHDGAPGVVTEADAPTMGSGASERMRAELMLLGLADRGVRSASVRLSPTVHGAGDNGFIAMFVARAREQGAAGYVGDGDNHWPAVHRSDAARLFRLAVESAPAGTVLHGAAEEGVRMREISEAIGRGLGVPARSLSTEEAPEHFGWLAAFAGLDVRASSTHTRELLGWEPTHPTLLEDLEAGHYFR